ncbi:MAG: hypothetical protein ACE5J9_05585 [Methanosarcinales archaeon]
MSSKINLSFLNLKDKELNKKAPSLGDIVRLVCKVKFKTSTGWTKMHNALFDTGAHTSLIPLSIWQNIETDMIIDHEIHGVLSKKECTIPVKFANICLMIHDMENNCTKPLKIHAYLSLMENVPLLIGFKDLLIKFKVCFDYEEDIAFIEEK